MTVDGDETLGLVLSESSLTVGEGDTTGDTYTVKLSHQPTVSGHRDGQRPLRQRTSPSPV